MLNKQEVLNKVYTFMMTEVGYSNPDTLLYEYSKNKQLTQEDKAWLYKLQLIHDCWNTKDWIKQFVKFAMENNLILPRFRE